LDGSLEGIETRYFIEQSDAPEASRCESHIIITEYNGGFDIRGRGGINIHPIDTRNGKDLFPVLIIGLVEREKGATGDCLAYIDGDIRKRDRRAGIATTTTIVLISYTHFKIVSSIG